MNKILSILLAILAFCMPAMAEAVPTPTPAIELITPTPSAEPLGTVFSSEDLIVTLPAGMRIMEENELEGYDAAVQNDFPNTARSVLIAVNEDNSAALTFSVAEMAQDAASAAKEASERILGSSAGIQETMHGQNSYAGFACAIGDQTYRLYYLSNGTNMLIIGASGLEESLLSPMLGSIVF